ncbi:cephalosporin hydroxylase family protein [Rhodopirellula sp. P2]|uniref:cephalosporin hydroxylase family protein n=1 Tax=Rhodopirellula sp. P2 TaxID=2127060 RepID=UPI002367F200|nr:cephalosporin hydroxylase family protein [Rhodopirellula sp. P2]WDQ17421.1 cephalosporin hydroxylase family protein [Rhodopirellula sp. P2]
MNPHEEFEQEVARNIESLGKDADLCALSRIWIREITRHNWAYNFKWLGRPAIQFPNDTWQVQELIWQCRPDVIIETGIAHGGSLIYSASMLALLDYTDAIENGEVLDPKLPKRRVVGIDIDIRSHNKEAIESHPMSNRIDMIEGSSVADEIVEQVKSKVKDTDRVLVLLDSNHTHDHVLAELNAYAPLVTSGSYCVAFDTIVEDMPEDFFGNRPWRPGNSPKSAVMEFVEQNPDFTIDKSIDHKLQISVAPCGYLRRK